jgi:tetratricopeptide (TPR) repeat protein
MERHRLEEAVELLAGALRHVKRDESLRAQLAAIQYRLGHADLAETTLRELIAAKPQYKDAYDMLYLQLMQKQRTPAARAVLESKWAATRQLESALQLAAHDDAQGERVKVRAMLERLEVETHDEGLALVQIGDFWLHRGEWDAARSAYGRGLDRHTGYRPDYVGRIAEWYLAQGRRPEARSWVEAEQKRYPGSALLEAYLAAVRLGEVPADGRVAERRRLESILAKMPDSPFVRYHLGRAYLLENKLDAAAEQFERSIKLDANYAAGWMALAELELARGNASLAESRANSALRAGQRIVPAILVRARAQVARGKYSEAEKILEEVLRSEPKNLEAQYWRGASLAAQGKTREAGEIFASGREAEPSNSRWIMAEAAVYLSAGRGNEARKLLEEAAKLFPAQEVFETRLADIQLAMRDGEAAQKTFEHLIQLQPGNWNHQLGLASAHALAGRPAKALEIYGQLQKTQPDNIRVWLEPAALLDELGRFQEAIAAYREALKRDKTNPVALNNLAWRLLQEGKNLEQALEYAQHAKRVLPRAAEVDGTLAEAYTRLAMHRNASAIYEEMLGYVDEKSRPRIQKLLEAARKRSAAKGRAA